MGAPTAQVVPLKMSVSAIGELMPSQPEMTYNLSLTTVAEAKSLAASIGGSLCQAGVQVGDPVGVVAVAIPDNAVSWAVLRSVELRCANANGIARTKISRSR